MLLYDSSIVKYRHYCTAASSTIKKETPFCVLLALDVNTYLLWLVIRRGCVHTCGYGYRYPYANTPPHHHQPGWVIANKEIPRERSLISFGHGGMGPDLFFMKRGRDYSCFEGRDYVCLSYREAGIILKLKNVIMYIFHKEKLGLFW